LLDKGHLDLGLSLIFRFLGRGPIVRVSSFNNDLHAFKALVYIIPLFLIL
jgi:hypothetical protein